ncbi:MAG: hypothetical protein PHF00_05100 [Elusimicrobia bacterium]|nr:hypothetical protein [Elusimicrobiota bacterium]
MKTDTAAGRGLGSLWLRLSGLALVLLSLALPYRLRWRWAYALNFILNRPRASGALLLKKPSQWLNHALLGVIYFIGIGGSWLAARFLGPKRGPREERTFWRDRGDPGGYDSGMDDQF